VNPTERNLLLTMATCQRILFLFDNLKDKYHTVGMDNLYLSLKFFRTAFTESNHDTWSKPQKYLWSSCMCSTREADK